MSVKHRITLIPGDGVGTECMAAARRVLDAAGVQIEWEECIAGAEVFKRGDATGVPRETIDSLLRTRVALKGPLETPVGYGEKSANVTLRKLFELYGNIRPTRELPGVGGPFAGRNIDLIVVRENVEDLYAGVEHMQTPGVAQCLKLITRKGCEKIVRLAFELARAEGRKKVHCATKSNIMKLTEGFLKRVFEEIAKEYPDIAAEHIIVDNCAHQLVRKPEQFDVIVTTNLNGDILSDLTSGLTGGLGLAPSANIGDGVAMFEAVHGSAPDIAGKNMVNPTALLLSVVMMLRYLGEFEAAHKIEHAVLVTLSEGRVLTGDLARNQPAASTTQFTDAVITALGKTLPGWKSREYRPVKPPQVSRNLDIVKVGSRRNIGVDIFVESGMTPAELGPRLQKLAEGTPLQLKLVSNRGVVVFPAETDQVDCVDHHRCRFLQRDMSGEVRDDAVLALIEKVGREFRWMHIERLQEFDGKPAYTRSQGED